MTEFGKRIKTARKHAKLSQEKLAKLVGIAQGTLSELENEGLSSIYTVQIAAACGVSPNWLATGEGEMTPQIQNVTTAEVRVKVPLLDWKEVERLQGVASVFDLESGSEPVYVNDPNVSARSFALRVSGDVMVSPHMGGDSFPHGMIVIFDPAAPYASGDYVLANDPATLQPTFKQLVSDAGRWFLKPLNPAYPTSEIDSPALRVVGRLVEAQSWRKF